MWLELLKGGWKKWLKVDRGGWNECLEVVKGIGRWLETVARGGQELWLEVARSCG
jgi:hypothetical protein